ncbi:hypothetical protein B0J14DRAFT_572699 [Halenospora varia]|nr:hypothetical protein B0J14DRAFT_572699 [Halenospora varia]
MLSCNACIERCLKNIIGDSIFTAPSIRTSVTANIRREPISRNFASRAQISRRQHGQDDERGQSSQWTTGAKAAQHGSPDPEQRNREKSLKRSAQVIPISKRETMLEHKMGTILQRYPAYANDPLKLAEYVRKALKGDDYDTALAVVRAASKGMSCTVSWNHLLDWQLSKGRMNAAMKTYNEMKKRGQPPDAHTFTIIIRGCTNHKDLESALSKVMAIYNSMLTEKSPVKPNSIHLNAVLKMCARARNNELMFSIVDQMPEKGLSAPNNLTFTTIINALRMEAAGDFRSNLTPMQKRQNAQKAILHARQLWNDVTRRWRKGDIWIDEELVCSMGRLMLLGQKQDWDDILSLVEQTMNVPRQLPRFGSKERYLMEPEFQGRDHELEAAVKVQERNSRQPDEAEETTALDHFEAFTSKLPATTGAFSYAKPGRNVVSLVMEALMLLKVKAPADKYWDVFIKDIGVKPDIENYHQYLRILRINHASSLAVELLEVMPRPDMRPATFMIAMSACHRDTNNLKAFASAGRVLHIMTEALDTPVVKVLTLYLNIALASTRKGHNLSNFEQGKRILRALDRLGPAFININTLLLEANRRKMIQGHKKQEKQEDLEADVELLVQRMIAAYDTLMDKALVPREQYTQLTQRRSKLAAILTRHKHYVARACAEIYELPPHLHQEKIEKEYEAEEILTRHAAEMEEESAAKEKEFAVAK